MKTAQQIDQALQAIIDATGSSKHPGMSYEEGIYVALQWVIEELTDEKFEYAGTQEQTPAAEVE